MSVEPWNFSWNHVEGSPRSDGFIAQDVHRAVPLLGVSVGDEDPEARPGDKHFKPWGVDQGKFTPYLWAAARDAYASIDVLRKQLADLQQQVAALRKAKA
jgi:hypothetical protein